MKTTYLPGDVTLLLTDITGKVEPMENADRERMIQSGVHYSEMIPREHLPSHEYLAAFYDALERYALPTARAVEEVSRKIYADRGADTVLVSLARAGTPIGILIKHCIEREYGVSVPHYSISIIRGRGIDKNAMNYLLERYSPERIQFVDGWTGKGAIKRQLVEAMRDYPNVDPGLAVLSDPAYAAGKCGTHDDFLIPSSCLNSTVSGLISRTFYRSDIIGSDQFHGALYYKEFEDFDLSYHFIEKIERYFGAGYTFEEKLPGRISPLEEIREIADKFGVDDINFVKPGIGEATRVLLRRIPDMILVHSLDDKERLGHIYRLAEEKQVPVEVYPLRYYRCCGMIKKLADA